MFDVEVLTKVGKNGIEYTCLLITFPNGYEKVVFLDKAEQYIVRQV